MFIRKAIAVALIGACAGFLHGWLKWFAFGDDKEHYEKY